MTKICILPDQVSGITTLNDGTKVYWTEGYSDTIAIHPDGQKERIPAGTNHPITQQLKEIEEKGADEYTEGTETDELEHATIRTINTK